MRCIGFGALMMWGIACGPALAEPVSSQRCAETTRAQDSYASLAMVVKGDAFGLEVGSPQDAAFVEAPAFGADAALALTVRGGSVTNGGNRAEISFNDSDPLCQEAWTRWRFMIPEDFVDPDPDALRWHIIAQWHDQPDVTRGESWETYPGNSPMIMVSYGVYEEQYAEALKEAGIPDAFSPGQPVVTLSYGVGSDSRPVGALPVEKGAWLTFTTHTQTSLGDDGFAAVWVDGRPLANGREARDAYARGRNMYNRAPAYLKLGLYRNPELLDINTVYLDEFERAGERDALRTPSRESP